MRVVAMLLQDGVNAFDVAVTHEVWGIDRTADRVPSFELRRCSAGRRSVAADGGLTVSATHGLDALADADLVVVPGRPGLAPSAGEVVTALAAAAGLGVPVAALCSGAFTLGAAGLLDGRRATTHWMHIDELRRRHPSARVERAALFVEDGGVATSAGTAASIDLCLELVRRAHGAEVAATIARRMVTAPHRDGRLRQRAPQPVPSADAARAVLAVAHRASERLDQPVSLRLLAAQAGVSERTFARRFFDATGTTPLRWLRAQRVRRAQELLESTPLPIDAVAVRVGFGSAQALRRHFTKAVGVPPGEYRASFAGRRVDPPLAG